MDVNKTLTDVRRLMFIPLINIFSNVMGAAIVFAWFSQIQHDLSAGFDVAGFSDWVIFFVTLIVTISIGFMSSRGWFWSLVRELKDSLRRYPEDDRQSVRPQELSLLVGKLLNVPIRFAVKSLWIWTITGIVFALAPYIVPDYFPWHKAKAMKISIWTVFVGAPISVIFGYFVSEWWLRLTVEKIFPEKTLYARPHSIQINVLTKLMAVCLMIGAMPAILISSFTLHRIIDIQTGHLSINSFLAQMPLAIGFLFTLSIFVAVCLSIFLARSVSEPLRKIGSAMNRIRKGDLDASIQVVSNDEIGVVGEGFNHMVEGLRDRAYIRETFGSYISESVVTEILESPEGVKLGGELREITILVSDLRGFTRMTDSLDPQGIIKILNRYFERMTDVVMRHQGTIIEFTGDGMLVFFGAPKPMSDHKKVAVACALAMQKELQELNKENMFLGWPELSMGIGINAGPLVVGNIGSEKRKKYGAVGTPINVAFRVESHAASGEILLTPTVYEGLAYSQEFGTARECKIKGFDNPITLCPILAKTQI